MGKSGFITLQKDSLNSAIIAQISSFNFYPTSTRVLDTVQIQLGTTNPESLSLFGHIVIGPCQNTLSFDSALFNNSKVYPYLNSLKFTQLYY